MKTYTANAPAKINLSLDVLGKLLNGYHSVKMIMQEIPLFDTITVEIYDGNEIEVFSDKPEVPTDERNTVFKAAKLFFEETKIVSGLKIFINKNIPAAAGMAGGSSDAASTLKLLNKAFDFPLSDKKILEICLKIGADVPFCYMGGCALSEGIGEVLTPVSPLKDVSIVIAKPQFEVSTKWVYENFRMENVKKCPDTDAVISAISMGDLEKLAENTANVLETVTETEYPVISEYKNKLIKYGALLAMMSGSGPTVFGIFKDQTNAKHAFEAMKSLTKDAFFLTI